MLCDDLVNAEVVGGTSGFKEVIADRASLCFHAERFNLPPDTVKKLEAIKLTDEERLSIVNLPFLSAKRIWVEFPYSARLIARNLDILDHQFPEKIGFIFESSGGAETTVDVKSIWKFKDDTLNFSVHDTLIDKSNGDIPPNTTIRSLSEYAQLGSISNFIKIGIDSVTSTYVGNVTKESPWIDITKTITSDNVEELDWILILYELIHGVLTGAVTTIPVDRAKLAKRRTQRGLLTVDYSDIVIP